MEELHGKGLQRRIRMASERFAFVCSILIGLVPIVAAAYWALMDGATLGAVGYAITPKFRVVGFVLALLPISTVLLALFHLRRLFGLYSAGIMFGARNVAALRGFGWSLTLFGAAEFVHIPLSSLVVMHFSPTGHAAISIGVGSDTILVVGIGAALLIIAWVMDEARKLDEDQKLTV